MFYVDNTALYPSAIRFLLCVSSLSWLLKLILTFGGTVHLGRKRFIDFSIGKIQLFFL